MRGMKLLRIVRKFRKGFLDGARPDKQCYKLCSALVPYLNLCGYLSVKLVHGDIIFEDGIHDHFWIMDGDMILDPTASQFTDEHGKQMPDIYFGELPMWYNVREIHE